MTRLFQSIFIIDSSSFNPLFNHIIHPYQLGLVFPRFRSEWCSYEAFKNCPWRSIRAFLGLEDEGIRMPHQGIRIAKSCIQILLSVFGYSSLYQSCVVAFQRESMFSLNDSSMYHQ